MGDREAPPRPATGREPGPGHADRARGSGPDDTDRAREALLVAALLGLAALSWIALGASPDRGMRTGVLTGGASMSSMTGPAAPPAAMAGLFLATWVVMMVAMMFPSIAPVTVTFDRWVRRTERSRLATTSFVGGYLFVWGASGLVAWAGIVYLPPLLPSGDAAVRLGAAALVLMGAYQLTPLKRACLRHCRSPLAFMAHHATALRRGAAGGLRVGASHGLFCLGCCWALMVVLLLVGMMSLTWMAAVAAVILLEKVLPETWRVDRAVGVLLVAAGIALLVWPGGLPALP